MRTDLRMVAPSLVTETFPARSEDCRILSMPLGPSDVFTRSATASAPQMEDCRGEGGVVGVGAGRGGGVRGRERAHAPPLGRCGTARG